MTLSFNIERKEIVKMLKQYEYNICTVRRFCYTHLGYTKESLEEGREWDVASMFSHRIAWKNEDLETLKEKINGFLKGEYGAYWDLREFLLKNAFERSPEIKDKFLNIIYNG